MGCCTPKKSNAASARKWWLGEISRIANDRQVEAGELITSTQVAELQAAVDAGTINDKLAREALAGLIAGEGNVAQIIEARGLTVVSDDSALLAAIDSALASQPDVAEKIRSGRLEAAGAIIGAVMKSMGGKADAARVRELLLERVAQG